MAIKELRFAIGEGSNEKRVNLREAMSKKGVEGSNKLELQVQFKQVQLMRHKGKQIVVVLDSLNGLQ
jgi:hypothetical protein